MLDYGGGKSTHDPGVLQARPAHREATRSRCSGQVRCVCVLARIMCSDQIASYIRDIDPTNVLKKNMLRSIQNCSLCAVKFDMVATTAASRQ